MCFSKPKAPPEPEAIQKPPEVIDPQVQAAGASAQKRARAASGAQSTILSRLMAPLQAPVTSGKTLTGQ
jgi:hypothetical protein